MFPWSRSMLLFSTNCPVQSYALHYDYKGKVSLVCDSRSQGPRFVSHCGHFGVPNWLIKGLVVCKIVLGRRYFLLCFLYSDRAINFAHPNKKKSFLLQCRPTRLFPTDCVINNHNFFVQFNSIQNSLLFRIMYNIYWICIQ